MKTLIFSKAGALNRYLGEALPGAQVEADADTFLAQAGDYDFVIIHKQSVSGEIDTVLESLTTTGSNHLGVASDYPQLREFLHLSQWPIRAYFHAYMAIPHYQQIPQALALGLGWYPPELLNGLIGLARETIKSDPNPRILARLSGREREIATLVGKGCSNAEVARQCHITERTVKSHLSNIFQKLNVSDRVSLAIAINRQG